MNALSRSLCKRLWLYFATLAMSAILPVVACADFAVKDAGPNAPANKDALEKLIASCRRKSTSFDKLMSDIENSKTAHVTITVGRGQGPFVDQASKDGNTEINLGNLDQFPDPDINPQTGEPELTEDVPSWATTRCEMLAHIMGEANATATAHASVEVGHPAGIREQNKVRKDFKQKPDCSGSVNEPPRPAPFDYTKISYGDANEKLSYKDGKVSIRYFKYDNKYYESPKKRAKTP